jgi:uncharacterized protein DUF3307
MSGQLAFFLALLVSHWIADFVLQTDWQATNKSKNNIALAHHVLVYTACLAAVSAFLFGAGLLWLLFVVGNGLLHFGTDYCTSRVSSRFYAKQEWHKFFVVVGFDQTIHQFSLAVTMSLAFHS